jgi:hypothetical protein
MFLLSVVFLLGVNIVGKPNRQDEERFAKIQDRIYKTTPEGREILKKNQKMKPEVNERLSSKNLEDSVLGYSQKAGKDKIYPIGWAASEKNVRAGSEKKGNRWRINFYFQDIQKQYLTAEWEYNKETGQLYPFEFQNAPLFWAKPKRKVRN